MYHLHHIGCAVENLEKAMQYYIKIFGYKFDKDYIDIEQNIKAKLLKNNNHYIELIAKIDVNQQSPIDKILNERGGGTYHHCYLTNDLANTLKKLKKEGFIEFTKKNIETNDFMARFVITPDNYLLEFLQLKERKDR